MQLDERYFDVDAPQDVTLRYLHEGCSDGKDTCLVVTKTNSGWAYYCHRCKLKGFKPVHGLPPSKVAALFRAQQRKQSTLVRQVQLPKDFTTEIPPEGLVWLYRVGITDYEISFFGIGWSKSYGRVILPVYQGRKLIYWQGRYVGKDESMEKYVNQKQVGREDTYFRNEPRVTSGRIVMVEDILSAIKVGRVSNCIGLLYAYVPDALVVKLRERYDEIVIWLDPDKSLYTLRVLKRLRAFGLPVRRVYSPKDPKYYNEEEIESFLEGGLNGRT